MTDKELLSHFKEMRCKDIDTTNFHFLDYVSDQGSPLDALFYSRLFWPEFVEINGMIFLKETIENDEDRRILDEALKYHNGDKSKTEESLNLQEIPSLFGSKMGEITIEEDFVLIERLAEMWGYKLQKTFPDREFTVQVLSEEETGGEIGFVFSTKRD